MTQPTAVHLWDVDHPYYCAEGNYFKNGQHLTYPTWDAFQEEWGILDDDFNLAIRWDWKRYGPADLDEDDDEQPGSDRLYVYWVLQRKAILRSTECVVTEAEEPAVRDWLARKAARLRLVWEPFLDATGDAR